MKRGLNDIRGALAKRASDQAKQTTPAETPVRLTHGHDATHCYLKIDPPGTTFVKMTRDQYLALQAELVKVLESFDRQNAGKPQ